MRMTETREKRGIYSLIQPRGEKCLPCARSVAKRTLGKVEVEDNKQASWCRSEHPKGWGFSPPPPAFPSEVKQRNEHSAVTLQCA